MNYKTSSKTKGKASQMGVALSGKKAGGLKKLQHFIGRKKRAAQGGGGGGVAKLLYGDQKPVVLKIHEGSYGAVLTGSAPVGMVESTLAAQKGPEAALAGKLVADVAETSPDVIALCETYKLRREELGRLTGFSLRALAEWASGKLPSLPAKRRLQEVRRLLDALAEIVKSESIPKWLHQPNPAFNRLTPLQVIELGEIDRLWAMVHDLGSGQAS